MKNNKFKVAGYLRLSVEDGDKEVSDSIISQKNIIEDKIKENYKLKEQENNITKNNNKKEIPLNQGIPSKLPVKNGRKSTCALSAPASTSLYISPTEKTRCIISLSPSLTAPVQKGTAVGSVVLYIDSKPYRSYPIYARQSIKKRTFAWYYKRMFYYLIH